MTVEIALSVEADGWGSLPGCAAMIERAVEEAQRRAGVRLADDAEVSILLCDDATIRSLNATWRGKDKATNVLSFPTTTPHRISERPMLGDIAIAWETLADEAEREGKTVNDHLTHLVVHGFLHLVGYDHESSADATAMERLETTILADLGIADPYADAVIAERDRA